MMGFSTSRLSSILIVFQIHVFVCGFVSCMPHMEAGWWEWKEKFDKTYMSETEEFDHWKIWVNNYKYVQEHDKTKAGFTVQLNFMADKNLSRTPIRYSKHEHSKQLLTKNTLSPPASWDWREKGVISQVRDQGRMGFVQAIVVTECVESYGAIRNDKLSSLSISEVTDCCVKTGVPVNDAFTCIHHIDGLCSAASYPNTRGRCMNNTCQPVVQVNGGKLVPNGDEMALMDAVYTMPVMAVVDASHRSFQLYRSGIYNEPDCDYEKIDHSLQVVGYGSIDGKDFWICKNSWGVEWGMQGYINIARNHGNMCGIATHATYPV